MHVRKIPLCPGKANASRRPLVAVILSLAAVLFIRVAEAAVGVRADAGSGVLSTPGRSRIVELDALWPLGGMWHKGRGVLK
ncbi:MAG: hypothetical protein ACYCQK_10630, partial [Acidiferrobacteraceae bacterium]